MLVPCRVSPLFFSLSLFLSWFTFIHPVDLSPGWSRGGMRFLLAAISMSRRGNFTTMARACHRRSWFLLRSNDVPRYDADTRWLMAMEVARSGWWRILVRRARVSPLAFYGTMVKGYARIQSLVIQQSLRRFLSMLLLFSIVRHVRYDSTADFHRNSYLLEYNKLFRVIKCYKYRIEFY